MSRGRVTTELGVAVGALHWLCQFAPASDPQTTQAAAELLVGALLDLEAYRRGDHDPRRRRTLAQAERIKAAHRAGIPVADLTVRFNRSRSQVYKLLSLATSRDGSVVSSPDSVNQVKHARRR